MPVGLELERARRNQGASLDEVAARTQIDIKQLSAIEREDLEQLPSLLSVRGAVHAYADEIGLDADDVSTRYVAQFNNDTALSEFASEGPPRQKASRAESNATPRSVRSSKPKVAKGEVSPWRSAHVAAFQTSQSVPVVEAGGILQLVDDRWAPPASGAPFYPRSDRRPRQGGVIRGMVVGLMAVAVGFTVAAGLDRVRDTLAPSSLAASPADNEAASDPGVTTAGVVPGDINGGWSLTSRFATGDRSAQRFATVGYRVRFKQEGVRISGTGYRAMENGHIIPLRQRTPITLEGRVDGRRIELLFTELGARGTSGGTWVLRLTDTGSLRGTFWNDEGAQSRGSAHAVRVAPATPPARTAAPKR